MKTLFMRCQKIRPTRRRFMALPGVPLFSVLFLSLVLFLCAAPHSRAQAGSEADRLWSQPTLTGSGTAAATSSTPPGWQGCMPYDGTPCAWDWYPKNGILQGLFDNDAVSFGVDTTDGTPSSAEIDGTITSTRHWIGIGPPPKTMFILETSWASGVGGYDGWGNGTATAVDAFGDPALWFPGDISPGMQSTGVRMVRVDSSSGTIMRSGHIRAMAATPALSNGVPQGESLVGGSFDWYAVSASLSAWSTACAPDVCQGHPNPAVFLEPTHPDWNPSAPRYFSGTGCEVEGTAVPANGYLTHAQLCIADAIGDHVVQEYWDTNASGKPYPIPPDGSVTVGADNATANLKGLFDSTHFKDSTMIVLKLKVWDSNGGYYVGKIRGPACNKALILQNTEPQQSIFSASTNTVAIESATMNYGSPSISAWTVPQIQNGLAPQTMAYISTHGFEGGFCSCDYNPALSYLFISGFDLFGTTAAANQEVSNEIAANPGWWNLLHPYSVQAGVDAKTLSQPSYNFVMLNSCSTVQNGNTDLATGFQIPLSSGTDRALIGNPVSNEIDSDNDLWLSRFWDLVSIGFTVREAVLLADVKGQLISQEVLGVPLSRFEPVIQGDMATTLHGVYGNLRHAGSMNDVATLDTTANRWYLPLH